MFGNSNGFPLSLKFLEKFQPKGSRYDYLAQAASRSLSFEKYDFNQSAQSGAQYGVWTVAATSTATTWAALAEPGGWLRGVTGASLATAALQLYGSAKFWNGSKGAGFASLIRLSAVTDVRVEQGFADVLPAIGTNMLNLPSNAFNSTVSGAVYVYDASTAVSATGLYTIGTSDTFSSVATTTNRYASGVTLFVAMELSGRTVKLWVGDGDAPLVSVSTGITASDGLIPFVAIKKAAGASMNIDIDTLWTWTLGRN